MTEPSATSVRVLMDPPYGEQMSLPALGGLSYDLHSLLYVAAYIDLVPRYWTSALEEHDGVARFAVKDIAARVEGATIFIRVSRISYNSPLEIILTAAAGASTAAFALNRLIDTYKRWQDARVSKASADVAVRHGNFIESMIDEAELALAVDDREKLRDYISSGFFSASNALTALHNIAAIESASGQAPTPGSSAP